jgi:putative ABC transport system permease protein
MRWSESLTIGLEALRAHKLRALLTALGIIFGVAAVVAMMSIGEGARREALQQIQLMGIRNVLVYDVPIENKEAGEGRTNRSSGLSLTDARALGEILPLVEKVVPEVQFTSDVQFGRESVEASVVGTSPDYADVLHYDAAQGRFFSFAEVTGVRRVCALGAGLKRELFYFRDAVGQQVRIGHDWYTVVGVMERRANLSDESAGEIRDTNRDVYIPVTSALQRFTRDPFASQLDRITVQVVDEERIREAANLMQHTLQRRHNEVEDFQIVVPEALLRQRQATQRIFNIVMGAIAGISLLVGGIGIMNIMLASVLERTREIGIRRAVGARQHDILSQFLLEATVVSIAGGLVGLALGFAMTRVIASYAGWLTVVSIPSVLLAFGVSAAVGIVFGFYPARRAARLHPIECLRYE